LRLPVIQIILLLLINSSCVKKDPMEVSLGNTPIAPVIQPGSNIERKYLALGDSYTVGHAVSPAESYPIQTKTWLKENGIKGINDPQIIATSGWTTLNLQAAIARENPAGPYDVVSILIGVNDQYQGSDTTGYRIHFTELIETCISLADNIPAHVVVLSIPDYSVTPFGKNFDVKRISREIDAFNAINKEIALAYKVHYLDITSSTREAAHDPDLICPDGLHPSGIEYKKWADKLGPIMQEILK